MRPETDMEKVRKVARTLLHLDIHPTFLFPMVVSHPFTNSGFVGLRDGDGNVSIGALLDVTRRPSPDGGNRSGAASTGQALPGRSPFNSTPHIC